MAKPKFLQPDSKFMMYLKRDARWVTAAIAFQMLGIALFALAIIIYISAGVGAFAFCIILLVFSMLCLIPGGAALFVLHREKKMRQGYVAPSTGYMPQRYTEVATPSYDNEYASNTETIPAQPDTRTPEPYKPTVTLAPVEPEPAVNPYEAYLKEKLSASEETENF